MAARLFSRLVGAGMILGMPFRIGRAVLFAVVSVVGVAFVVGFGSASARSLPGCPGGCPPRPPLSADESRAAASKARSDWLHEISTRGKKARTLRHPTHFRSPSRATFLARLQRASHRYHFQVVRVHLYKPFQFAPLVIVRSAHPKRFSRDTHAIQLLLDPVKKGSALATASAYEAIYIEARDTKGVPFLLAFQLLRGGIEGGQWARSENLYPFAHG